MEACYVELCTSYRRGGHKSGAVNLTKPGKSHSHVKLVYVLSLGNEHNHIFGRCL